MADLRKKILFTLFIIIIFRIGSVIPVPFIDVAALKDSMTGAGANEFFSYLAVLTGGGLEYGAIFAMSVTPYINASISIQLLTVAIPPLERLSKDCLLYTSRNSCASVCWAAPAGSMPISATWWLLRSKKQHPAALLRCV